MTSPGARYSAGTAFLDVVPSFRGVQQAIAREVRQMEKALGKEAGDEFGKQFEDQAVKAVDKALGTTKASARKTGKEAAEEYAGQFANRFKDTISRMQREISTFKFDAQFDDKALQNKFNAIRRDIKDLNGRKIGLDVEAGPAMIELDRIEARVRQLQDASVDLAVRTNLGAVAAQVEAFRKAIQRDAEIVIEPEIKVDRQLGLFEKAVRKRLQAALENFPPIEFDADVTPAQAKLMELRRQMIELGDKRIGVDIDGSAALAEMERLRVQLAKLANDETIDVQVRTDAAAAATELLAIRTLAKIVDDTEVEVKVKVDTKTFVDRIHALRKTLTGAGADGEDAANGFRAFNGVALAGATLLPSVIPILTALAGGLLLIGPAALGAAAGLGVLAFGFSGISDAVSAITKQQENASKDAEASAKRIRAAGRSVADAERAVTRARDQAGRAATDAARQVADAVDAQEQAERDLGRAQRDAQRAQEDLTEARQQAREELEDLQLTIRGGALAERKAVMDLADAQREYDASLADPSTTADERARLLLSLEQEQLNLDRVRESNADLAAEQAEWARTGVEGSDRVVGAQERVQGAQEGVRTAMERVADAAQNVQDAIISQQQTNAEAAQSIADAQLNLIQAQEDYQTAITETSASTQALEIAMGKLGPAGQAFAIFWAGVLPQFRELRELVQAGMFPGLQEAISDILTVNGPLLATFMTNMGNTLGDLFAQFGDMMTSPQWMGIWATFNEYAPIFLEQFGQVAMAMLTFFGELFQGLAPYSERFGDALVRLATASAEWMASFTESQTFRDIMEWLFTNGPIVFDAIWDIARAIGNIFIALEPLGMLILGALDGIAEWIADMDPQTLGIITTAVLGLFAAFQLAAGALSIVLGLGAILSTGIGLIVFVVAAAVAALVILYTQSEDARRIMDAIFRAIGEVISFVWNYVIKPLFEWFIFYWGLVAKALLWEWENVIEPVWNALSDAAEFLWNYVLKPIFEAIVWGWEALAAGFMWVWDYILNPLWEIFKGALEILVAFLTIFVFGPLALAWHLLSEGFVAVYDGFLKPLWKAFQENFQALMDFLQPAFDLIAEGWHAFLVGMQWIYDEVLYPYIIKPFMGAMDELSAAFETSVNAITEVWGWLRKNLAKPINFVIETILNKGLFGAFNWIIDTLGLPGGWKIKDWAPITVDGEVPRFAAGGRVPGWSPNDKADNIPAMLTANEFVQPVDAVNYYGADFMEAIRRRKIRKEDLAHFATGGLVGTRAYVARPENRYGAAPRIIIPAELASGGQLFAMIKAQFPRAKLNSSYRPGDPGLHGRDMAVDLGEQGFSGGNGRPYLAAMNRWIYDNFHNVSELIYNGTGDDRPNIKNGKDFPYSTSTQNEHKNHVHLGQVGSLLDGKSGGNFLSGAFDAVANAASSVWNSVTSVLDSLKDSITGPVSEFLGHVGNNPMGKIIAEMPGKAVGWVWDKIKDSVADFLVGSSSDDAVSATAAAGGSTAEVVKQAFSTPNTWDSGPQWDAVANIIAKESGWDPKAQNPNSTASGLFQHINATWRTFRPAGLKKYASMKDAPVALQALAGRDYIASRYGSPVDAWAHWQSHRSYSEGGQVTDPAAPTLYDTGGWLPPGITTVLNATNKPEPILTGQQWEELTAGRDEPGYNGPLMDVDFHGVDMDQAGEIWHQLDHGLRVMRSGGKYAKERVGAGS